MDLCHPRRAFLPQADAGGALLPVLVEKDVREG